MASRKATRSTKTLAVSDANEVAGRNSKLAASLHKTATATTPVTPQERLSFALVITNNHYRAVTAADFAATIVESLDEPFEIQNMLFALNMVEGPWANAQSFGRLRWLPASSGDLKPLKTVGDFLQLTFIHLVPGG